MSATRTTLTTGSLLVLAVLFVALIILSNMFLRGARLDLTENHLYTLSEGTRNILGDIDEPINLYFFYSERASRDIPVLRTYATRVRELLDEFVQVSKGQLNLHVIDPLPFSEDEDRAAQFGLQSIPVGANNETVYFGLAGTNSTDGLSVVPFFQPDKEAFLEYDLTKLIYNLANPEKPVLALISSLPMTGGFDPMTRQPGQPWVIYEQLQQLFDVRVLGGDIDQIDDDVRVLMVVHPKNLSDKTRYAIDQYVLGGGHAMFFVDPQAELETPLNPNDPSAMFAEKSSDLPELFKAWGIEYNKDQIIGDSGYALSVSVSADKPPVRHLGILSIEKSGLD
ncbi:MAG: GldG family protein, partial [Candidatus Competibacteraceae bacterium]|nr:GldG family protein [Candidatus Competibacteraceae bacterium]